MSKPWDDGAPAYLPLRKSSMFGREPIHLTILQKRLAGQGIKVHKRCLYRWMDIREKVQPRLRTAIALAEVLEEFIDLDKIGILERLARMEEVDAARSP